MPGNLPHDACACGENQEADGQGWRPPAGDLHHPGPGTGHPQVLDAYVKAFDPSFVALYGSLEETAATAKEFDVFFEKVPSGSTYTLSHTATSYVYDSRGTLRLGLSQSLSAQECTEDLLTVMEVC